MLTEKPKFENPKNNNKSLDIADVINETVEIYKKMALIGGLAYIILMSILVFFGIVGLGFFINPEDLQETLRKFNPEKLSTNGQIIYFGGSILVAVLLSPIIAGILKMADDASKNQEISISSLYFYINSPFFINISLATLCISTSSIVSSLALRIIFPGNIGIIISSFFSILISILTFITIPLILFKNLNYLEAIKNSCQQIGRNFFVVLFLIIVAGIFAIVGVFAFCIGIVFTMPAIYSMQYSIYKRLSE